MTSSALYALLAIALAAVGLDALITRAHLIRKIMALNVLSSAVFLLLITLGGRGGGEPDPVPQAMVLTGIVVAVSATALALALARRIHARTGRCELAEHEGLE